MSEHANLLRVEEAWADGRMIGLRISHPHDKARLIIYADGPMSGCLRDGGGFVPAIGGRIEYMDCPIGRGDHITERVDG